MGKIIPLIGVAPVSGTASAARDAATIAMPKVVEDLRGPAIWSDRERARIWRRFPDGRTISVQNLYKTQWTTSYLDSFQCRYLVEVSNSSNRDPRPYPVDHLNDLPSEIAMAAAAMFDEYLKLVANERDSFAQAWAKADAKAESMAEVVDEPEAVKTAPVKDGVAEPPSSTWDASRRKHSENVFDSRTLLAALVLFVPAIVGLHSVVEGSALTSGSMEVLAMILGTLTLGAALHWLLRDH